jgi:Kinesin motor domain
MMRRNHLLGSSLDELLGDATTSSTEVSSAAGGSGMAALLLMELDRPGNSLVDDVLPYSSSPSSSPASTPTRAAHSAGKTFPKQQQPTVTSTSRKSSSYIAALKEAGRRRQSRNSSVSPDKKSTTVANGTAADPSVSRMENDNDDQVIRSFLEKKQNTKYPTSGHDMRDDASHILSTPHHPKVIRPTEQQPTPPRTNQSNRVHGAEGASFISPVPRTQRLSSLSTGPPISPFSPLFHQRKRRRTPTRKSGEEQQSMEKVDESDEIVSDLSLSVCRKVSVVVWVVPTKEGDNGGSKNRCLFPASEESSALHGSEPTINGDGTTTSSPTAASSRQLIVVNPSALGAQQAQVTMDTARYVANVAQISSEDWTRLYKYHQVVWSDDAIQESATREPEAFLNISHAMANDLSAPGSIAHRIVVATSTGPARLERSQTAQLFGIVGQQSVARVFAAPSETHEMTEVDVVTRYGLAGLTVHALLLRMSSEAKEPPVCNVSILEVSADGDELLYDLLASRPFSHQRQPVTIRYHGNRGPGIFQLDGLSETPIESLKQFGHLLRRAFTAALHVHRHAPRGHIVVSVYPAKDTSGRRTCCQFVDLAVAECENRNSTANEGNFRRNTTIRKSLWALGGVLRGLLLKEAGNDTPVSYRESVLTKVLQRSLLPTDSRTIVLAAVAPEVDQYDETMSTLRYVNRLLHRPVGPVVQSPFAATSSVLGSSFSSPTGDRSSSLRLDQFAGQERVLLKEIVSDPRQRLAKVLKPLNHHHHHTNPFSEPPKTRPLEQYIPTDYNDPEEELKGQVEPSLQRMHDESMFLSSPGETDDLIELQDDGYWSSSFDEAAPTPQTRNANRGQRLPEFNSEASKNASREFIDNTDDLEDRRDVSAMDELLEGDGDAVYRPDEVSPLTADTGRASRYAFPDLLADDDVLDESYTLDYMAVQVAENAAPSSHTHQDDFRVPQPNDEKSQNRRNESIDELTDENDYGSGQLEDILREGSIEEEIVFSEDGLRILPSTEENVEDRTLESLLQEPDYTYDDDVLPESRGLAPHRGPSIQAYNHEDQGHLSSTNGDPRLHIESFVNEQDREESFTKYDLPLESPKDIQMRDIPAASHSVGSPLESNDECDDALRTIAPSDTSIDEDFDGLRRNVQASVPSTQRLQSLVSETPTVTRKIDSMNQRSSPNHPLVFSSLYRDKTSPHHRLDATQLTDVASQKVQDEINQLQAAVDKVKQTNISVWQSSLDSINNLRYFQTAHQEALAQLLVEQEASSKEIERLTMELDRRSEVLENVTSQYETDIESLRLHKSNIESERAEVFKIAEEAIATQATLEQRVAELELELNGRINSTVPRTDYESLEKLNLSYEHELHSLKSQFENIQKEVDEMTIAKSTLLEALDLSEKDRTTNLKDLESSQGEITSLKKQLLMARKFQNDAENSAREVSRLEDELQSVRAVHSQQWKALRDECDSKDEFMAQCKQELDTARMDLIALQEKSDNDAELWLSEIEKTREELSQLQEEHRLYPSKLEEFNRQLSQLQLERDGLAQALDEAEQSLYRRVSDVRELTDNLKGLLSEKEKDQTKMSRMERALSSFQEETRSRLETIVSHRNEAASLLEKTVNENKALVEVNNDLQSALENLQRERDEMRIELREFRSDHAMNLEDLKNENRTLAETNENLQREIETFHSRRLERSDQYSDQSFPRVQRRARSSFNPNGYSSVHRELHSIAEPRDYVFEKVAERPSGRSRGVDLTQLQLAEEVAASVAFSAKATMETHSSETNVLKEKLFALEDSKDDEINALKVRIKALERRLTRTEPPSRYNFK